MDTSLLPTHCMKKNSNIAWIQVHWWCHLKTEFVQQPKNRLHPLLTTSIHMKHQHDKNDINDRKDHWEMCIRHKLWLLSLVAHFLYADMKGEGPMSYTATNHQGEIKMFGLYFCQALLLFHLTQFAILLIYVTTEWHFCRCAAWNLQAEDALSHLLDNFFITNGTVTHFYSL